MAWLLTKVRVAVMFIAPVNKQASAQVGQNIKEQRKARGWSVTELADRVSHAGCEIERTQVSKIEHGRLGVTVDRLVGFAAAFGIDAIVLLREPGWSKFPWASEIDRKAVGR